MLGVLHRRPDAAPGHTDPRSAQTDPHDITLAVARLDDHMAALTIAHDRQAMAFHRLTIAVEYPRALIVAPSTPRAEPPAGPET